MNHHSYGQNTDEPRVGGGFVAVFLLFLLACVGAFGAASAGVFKPAPPARMMIAPGRLESVLAGGSPGQGRADRETRPPVTGTRKAGLRIADAKADLDPSSRATTRRLR
jgi:hypothetical protein